MRITRLVLKNWRNFKDVDVQLRKRVFLVGPNASGKSNFLDAFRFLREIAVSGGGLERAVSLRGGVSKVRSLHSRRYPNIIIAVELGDNAESPEWSYHLEFNQNNNKRPIVKREIVKQKNKILLDRNIENEADDPELQTQTDLEQVRANIKFRGIPEFFRTIQYLHIVPQLVREPDRSVGKADDPFGGDFLERLAKFKNDQGNHFEKRLNIINNALNVAVPQLKNLTLEKDYKGNPHLKGLFEHWRSNAASQEERDFSDGTLRLLGMLWSILDVRGPLLLEEPELSLHPGVVRYIPQMFARIVSEKKQNVQFLVSTHSVDILSDTGIDPGEILLLRTTKEGSKVESAASITDIKDILNAGINMADIIISKTTPEKAGELPELGKSEFGK